MTVTNPTPKSLMKNVDFTECFCTNSEEKFKLHIIHQHFLKILSKYFFLFPKNSMSLSGPSSNPPLQLLHPFSACVTAPSTLLSLVLCYRSKHCSPSFLYISMSFLFFNLFLMQTNIAFWGSEVCVFHLYFFKNSPFSQGTYI